MTEQTPATSDAGGLATGAVRRMHLGCGDVIVPGWINCDVKQGPGIDMSCDIRAGVPLPDDHLDYIVAHHVLQDLKIYEQVGALRELCRILRPGGVLRLSLPDLDRAIEAYRAGRREYFHVWDWDTIAGNFITHVLWYNLSSTPFTWEFAEELLGKAGFATVCRVQYGVTGSGHADIVILDSRPDESFYVEAVK